MKINRFNKSLLNTDWFTGWLFLSPFLLLWVYWFFFPLLQSVGRSFQSVDLLKIDQATFNGITNYINVFKNPEFLQALKNSFLIVAIAVPVQTVLALVSAMAVNVPLPGRVVFRTLFSIPYITSPIAVTTVFMVLFRKGNVLVTLLSKLGFPDKTWYADIHLALPFIMLIYIWRNIGFYMIIYLAGLQDIPKELYEAATVDGADELAKFRHITVPMLKNVTFFVVTLGIISAFQIFDEVAAISRYGALGSPAGTTSTLVTYFYQYGIRYRDIGHGSAAVIIFFFIILAFTAIQKRIVKPL